ncbi:hypothetical protein B0H10DRAFT_2185084 [Mycena sp. CBHHK59/15]|nr:hypothetical protein B0H10DRAFT_2185084 [Mycena sp. CBHHK59/15]
MPRRVSGRRTKKRTRVYKPKRKTSGSKTPDFDIFPSEANALEASPKCKVDDHPRLRPASYDRIEPQFALEATAAPFSSLSLDDSDDELGYFPGPCPNVAGTPCDRAVDDEFLLDAGGLQPGAAPSDDDRICVDLQPLFATLCRYQRGDEAHEDALMEEFFNLAG